METVTVNSLIYSPRSLCSYHNKLEVMLCMTNSSNVILEMVTHPSPLNFLTAFVNRFVK